MMAEESTYDRCAIWAMKEAICLFQDIYDQNTLEINQRNGIFSMLHKHDDTTSATTSFNERFFCIKFQFAEDARAQKKEMGVVDVY
jgi:formyltetrahydrofolate hydrolase